MGWCDPEWFTFSFSFVSAPFSLRCSPLPLFSCGNSQQGNFYNGPVWTFYQPLDGLLGLGRGSVSLMAQLGKEEKGFALE